MAIGNDSLSQENNLRQIITDICGLLRYGTPAKQRVAFCSFLLALYFRMRGVNALVVDPVCDSF
jgi:hypothetical protein